MRLKINMEQNESIQNRIDLLSKEIYPELPPGKAEALNKNLDGRIEKLKATFRCKHGFATKCSDHTGDCSASDTCMVDIL